MDLSKDIMIQISLYLDPADLQSFIGACNINFTLIDYLYVISTKYPQHYHQNINKYNIYFIYVGISMLNHTILSNNMVQIHGPDYRKDEKNIIVRLTVNMYNRVNDKQCKNVYYELIKYLLIEFLIKKEDIVFHLNHCGYVYFKILFNEYLTSLKPSDIDDIYRYRLNHYQDNGDDLKIITYLAHYPDIEEKCLT